MELRQAATSDSQTETVMRQLQEKEAAERERQRQQERESIERGQTLQAPQEGQAAQQRQREIERQRRENEAEEVCDERGCEVERAQAAAGAVAVLPARRTTGSVGVSSDGRSSALSIRRGSIEDVSWANPTIYEEGRTFIEEVMKVEESEEKIAAGMRRNYGRPVIGVGER